MAAPPAPGGGGARVAALAAEIRDLKAELARSGLSSAAVNRHAGVAAKVQALRDLKAQLDADDPARDEAFFARQKADKDKAKVLQADVAAAQRGRLAAAEAAAPRPLVQRKIFHLFRFAGSGASFRYEPPARLNADQCGFGAGDVPHPAAYVTEKWDGTTMQATSTHIFKRLDLWGGKRRATQDPSQRYDLRLIAWRGDDTGGHWQGLDFVEADGKFKEALTPYLPRLARLDAGLCAYFEVVHTDINATYKGVPGLADLRVFDFSRMDGAAGEGHFLPFEETIFLAGRFGLPVVGWHRVDRADAADLWARLRDAAGQTYATAAAPLEGFVLREAGGGGRVAKARVEHLPGGDVDAGRGLRDPAGADGADGAGGDGPARLAALGLPVVRSAPILLRPWALRG